MHSWVTVSLFVLIVRYDWLDKNWTKCMHQPHGIHLHSMFRPTVHRPPADHILFLSLSPLSLFLSLSLPFSLSLPHIHIHIHSSRVPGRKVKATHLLFLCTHQQLHCQFLYNWSSGPQNLVAWSSSFGQYFQGNWSIYTFTTARQPLLQALKPEVYSLTPVPLFSFNWEPQTEIVDWGGHVYCFSATTHCGLGYMCGTCSLVPKA